MQLNAKARLLLLAGSMLVLLLGTASRKNHLCCGERFKHDGASTANTELVPEVPSLKTDANAKSGHGTLDNTVSLRTYPQGYDVTLSTDALRGQSLSSKKIIAQPSAASHHSFHQKLRTLQNEDEAPWVFTVSVGIHKPTSDYYGGFEETKSLVYDQFRTVNSRFIFNKPVVFDVMNIYEFSESPLGSDGGVFSDHSGYDYLVVYDGFPTQGGGWYGRHYSIHHSWSVDLLGGPFGAYATDALTHEFGHARGCNDIYALQVKAENNPVNGQAYQGDVSIMNYPYGETVWDEHCKSVVNVNANKKPPELHARRDPWPFFVDFKAVDSNGLGLDKVRIQLFRVLWYSRSVDPTREQGLRLETDSSGRARWPMLETNLFGPDKVETPNFLVEFSVEPYNDENHRKYTWIPFTDVVNAQNANPAAEVFEVVMRFETVTPTGSFPKNFNEITCTYASCISKVFNKYADRTQFGVAQDAYDTSLLKMSYAKRVMWKQQRLVRSLKRLTGAMNSIVELRETAPNFSNDIGAFASTCAINLVESSITAYKGKGILDDEFLNQVPKYKLAKAKKKRTKKQWNKSVSMSLGAIGVMMDELGEHKVPLC